MDLCATWFGGSLKHDYLSRTSVFVHFVSSKSSISSNMQDEPLEINLIEDTWLKFYHGDYVNWQRVNIENRHNKNIKQTCHEICIFLQSLDKECIILLPVDVTSNLLFTHEIVTAKCLFKNLIQLNNLEDVIMLIQLRLEFLERMKEKCLHCQHFELENYWPLFANIHQKDEKRRKNKRHLS